MTTRHHEFEADDRTFYCTRKVAYPIRVMAERDAESLSKSLGYLVSVYLCPYNDHHYHIGHQQAGPEDKRMEYKFFVEESGVLLAKIRIQDSQFVFMLPKNTPENEYSVLDNGILVGIREGTDLFREKDGVKSKHWQIMTHILPMYPKDPHKIKDRLDQHLDNMVTYDKALMDLLNRSAEKKEEHKRILVRPERQQVEEQEMHQNRAVFRTPDGKPFYRDIVTCSCDNCNEEIELRAYISQNDRGELTFVNKRVPLDGRAKIKPGSRGALPKWICKTCVKKLGIDKEEYQTELHSEHAVIPITSVVQDSLLNDLQGIAADTNIDPNFVRGATLMVCYILSP
jgi:hypothetical protein